MLPETTRKRAIRHEVQMAMILVWIVLPVVLTLGCFYLGTFVASQHVVDIQQRDIDNGKVGAVIGLVLAGIVALATTVIYPKVIEREYSKGLRGHEAEPVDAHH